MSSGDHPVGMGPGNDASSADASDDAVDTTVRHPVADLIVQTSTPHVEVTPGASATVTLSITNVGEAIDGLTAVVDGLDPDWVSTDRPMVAVFPDETERVTLTLDVPTTCPAGDYLVVVRFLSALGVDREGAQDFWLRVSRRTEISASLRPRIVTGGKKGRLLATVENLGNAATAMRVTALDPTRETTCRVDPGAFHVPIGGTADIDIEFRGKRPWFGQVLGRTILITTVADPHDAEPVVDEQVATFNQKPRIPRGLVTALILAGIIVLWALIFFLAITGLRSQDAPAKAIGSNFMEAPERIPLDVVAATADGVITASTTGDGVPRATVEAVTIAPDGSIDSIASAASGAEGIYTIPTLLPGEYLLRVSADGFGDRWYPGVATSDEATPVVFGAGATVGDLDVELVGQTGQIVGAVAVPPEAAGQPLTVTATQQPEHAPDAAGGTGGADAADDAADAGGADSGAAGAAPASETIVTTDGTIDISGLPAPATYDVRVEGDGFDTVTFEQDVRPGAPTVLDTVQIGATDGVLAGTVVDAAGGALGDVAITARNGDFVQTTTSATTGGGFRIIGLATPATYVLSFERDGFSSTSIALELGPGSSNETIVAQLIGGSGTIDGIVRDATGTAVGGVMVEVVGGGFRQETATLTSGGAGGVVGGFTLRDLPVPGAYTVTFRSDAFLTETREAVFDGAGTTTLGDVVLVPATVRLSGTVRAGATGIAQATVSLSNGETAVATLSATNPAGTFAFDGVAEGTYTLTVAAAGFIDRTVLLRIEPGADIVRDVALEPEATASVFLSPGNATASGDLLFGLPEWTEP